VGGGIAGVALIRILYPTLSPAQAAGVVVPDETADSQDLTGFARADSDGGRPARGGLD